jgi:hypothetical protein
LSNHYAADKSEKDNKIIYYAGFGWKKQGTFVTKKPQILLEDLHRK